MNILLIQENGRHEANKNFRECFSLKRAFEKFNHSCEIWGEGHDNFDRPPDYENYDWIINLENYDSGWVPNLSGVKKPTKFLWSIDAHCRGEEVYENVFKEGKYDFMLHSAACFVKKDYHIWFPNCFDELLIKKTNTPKVHDLGFCGNYVNRKPLLDYLQERHGIHLDVFVIGEEMVKAINSYKCHFNYNMAFGVNEAINYRNFETLGCGTLLLTSYSPEYKPLNLIDGDNCFIYNNSADMDAKIDHIKSTDISEIANKGFEESSNHTYTKRVEALLSSFDRK
jgi:hypothetical protein